VGLVGALHLYPDRVEITAGRYEAKHPRPLRRPPTAAFDWKAMGGAGAPATQQRPMS
jgi:hypothetical protein